jgi:hypothetical protein
MIRSPGGSETHPGRCTTLLTESDRINRAMVLVALSVAATIRR